MQEGDKKIAERGVVFRVAGEVTTMLEASAGEEDGQIMPVVRVGVAEVTAVKNHGAVEQGFVGFLLRFESIEETVEGG